MVSIPATTVEEYLAQLPEDRRAVMTTVRALVRKRLPKGYVERPMWGMVTYSAPLEVSGPTYNGQPLCYAAIAAQKNHYSIYLMGPYGYPMLRRRLEQGFADAGKRLDMGKSCVRFKSLDAIPLDVIGDIVAAVPMERFVAYCQAAAAKTKAGGRAKGARRAATAPAKKQATKSKAPRRK